MSCRHDCQQGRTCTCAAQATATGPITGNSDGSSTAHGNDLHDDTGLLLVRGILLIYSAISLAIYFFY